MLMPAAILVMMVLGAIAVDSAIAFLAQRQLADIAAAAANDAAGEAVHELRLYEQSVFELDEDRAIEVAELSLAARGGEFFDITDFDTRVVGPARDRVEVVVEARVPRLFAPTLPGGLADRTVTARALTDAIMTSPEAGGG